MEIDELIELNKEEQEPEFISSYCRFCGKVTNFLVHFDNKDKIICSLCGYNKNRQLKDDNSIKPAK